MGKKRWLDDPARKYMKSRIRDFRAAQVDSNVPAFMSQSFQRVLELQPLPEPTREQFEEAREKLSRRAVESDGQVREEAVQHEAKEQIKAKRFNVRKLLGIH